MRLFKLEKISLLLILIGLASQVSATDWQKIESSLVKKGGNVKALSHMKCFMDEYKSKAFPLKEPDNEWSKSRCYAKDSLSLTNDRFMTLIDYTLPASKPRLFLIDLNNNSVKAIGVGHGRFKSGYIRFRTSYQKNSTKWAKYFSNRPGSRAPSSGFYFAGQEYEGKFGRSLIMHGLEPGVNDYACERAVVIHKHLLVSKRRAYVMSSGCPMVSWGEIDPLINAIKGQQSGIEIKEAGGLVFIYGPREKDWQEGSCSI